MTNRRMLVLVGVLAAVLAIRWWDPLGPATEAAEAGAVVRTVDQQSEQPTQRVDHHVVSFGPPVATSAAAIESTSSAASTTMSNAPLAPIQSAVWPVRSPASESSGNAFALRTPVVIAAPAPPPVIVRAPPPFVGQLQPPPPPPEPAPPLQVIGTWQDGPKLAVFLSGPSGTLLAHAGDMLLSDYKVQGITAQQLSLLHTSTQKVWSLPIPAPPAPSAWPTR